MSSSPTIADVPSEADPGSPEGLGALLRRARERAGLSLRALGERMGVSWVTVREVELGRDPKRSTLGRFLTALPTLTPEAVLCGDDEAAALRREAWAAHASLGGMRSRLASRTVLFRDGARRLDVLRVSGLRSARGTTDEPTIRRDLMMSACVGTGAAYAGALAAAEAPNSVGEVEDGLLRHRFVLERGPTERTVGYRCVERYDGAAASPPERLDPRRALELGLAHWSSHATERLLLRVVLPDGWAATEPTVHAWPECLLPGDDPAPLASALEAASPVVTARRGGSDLRAAVDHPLPGLVHAICWDGMEPARKPSVTVATASPGRERAPLPDTLARAREAAGVSRRELARRMGASDMLVRTAERGRDVRRSTLRAYLSALPDLQPGDLLEVRDTLDPMNTAELWHAWRGVFGCVADEECKVMTVRPDGGCDIAHVVRGLRATAGRARELRLLDPQQPNYYPHGAPRCRSIDVGPGEEALDVRTRLMRLPDGRVAQEIVIPETLAEHGAAFRRDITRPSVFHLTSERARAVRGPASGGPYLDGGMLFSTFPASRRVLEVRFPEGYWPHRITSHAWPSCVPPYVDGHEIGERLHGRGLRVEASREHARVRLTVDGPLVGFKYGLLWELP